MPRGQPARRGGRRPYQLRNRAVNANPEPPQRRNARPVQPLQQPDVRAVQQPLVPPAPEIHVQQQAAPPAPIQQPVVPPVAFQQPAVLPATTAVGVQATQGNVISLDVNNVTLQEENEPLLIPGFSNETDVFISQTLKDKVWNFEYVDLALFLRQNFESNVGQKSSNLEVIDGKLVLQQKNKKIKSIDNISTWTNAFINYLLVLIENHPNKAGELIKYMSVIRNIADECPSCRWLLYDQQFRLRISRNPSKSWGSIDGELWLRFITLSIGRPFTQNRSRFHCFDYNYKGNCNKFNCIYRHACIKCQMQHPSIYCVRNMGFGVPNPANLQQVRGPINQHAFNLQKPGQIIRPRQPFNSK